MTTLLAAQRLPGKPAFTLAEMLLALALSSVIGLVVLMMLSGLASATQSQFDVRRAGVKRQVAIVRLGSTTRGATMVLARNAETLVLWKGDVNGDAKPNLSELRRIEWKAELKEIWTYQSPANINPAFDETFELSADFIALTALHAGSAVFPGDVTLQGVAGWTSQLDSAIVTSARVILLQLTLESESGDEVATIVSALRISAEGLT